MQNLQLELTKLLEKDDRFTADGKLLKNKVIEAALQLDPSLLKLLLSHKSLKKHFFRQVDLSPLTKGGDTEGVWVFDKIEFQKFVSNKSFLKDSYTAFSNKIGLTSDDEFISESKDVVLSWPHKDCVLEGGQTKEDEKRDEIFWNETLAPDEIDRLLSPKVFTNFKKYDSKGEHKVTDISLEDNLIIKGNNLLALHSLLPVYRGRIKLIYIDPPYNTGNDEFNYNDDFNHSTWLTFMRNRLNIAKQLLAADGLFFVQIDYRELAYLKILCDEIFFRNNFIGQVNWQRVPEGRTLLGQGESDLKISTEYILIYAYNKRPDLLDSSYKKKLDATEKIIQQYSYYLTIDSEPKEFKRIKDSNDNDVIFYSVEAHTFKPIKEKTLEGYLKYYDNAVQSVGVQEESSFQRKIINITSKTNKLCIVEYTPTRGKRKNTTVKDLFIGDRKLLYAKDFSILEDKRLYRLGDINDFWSNSEIQVTDIANEGNVNLRRGKKPEELLQRIIEWSTNKNDLILDFFVGSGTTCAVANKLGRKFIGIEQLDYGKNDCISRLKYVIKGDQTGISKAVDWKGGGSFVYCELSKLNHKFVYDITKSKTAKELKQIWESIKKDGFISYKLNPKDFDNSISEFEGLSIADQKKLLIDVLDKNHLYVNYSEIDDKDYKISDEDKKLNKKFYSLK